jgi:hypothetical protein
MTNDTFTCPRRHEDGTADPESPFVIAGPDLDEWVVRDDPQYPGLLNTGMPACSYCGSLNPDFFMEKIESEGWTVGPTDKSYKAYVRSTEGPQGKFYFQHLSDEQKVKFVELLNKRSLSIGVPGHFYKKPYFLAETR